MDSKNSPQISEADLKEDSSGEVNIAGVPLFLKKLWKILYDEEAQGIIEWNTIGDGFIIFDQIQFMLVLLPKYFKHNNLASFVRQLNMYDFHKRQHSEKDGEMEFSHTYFIKDLPELLKFINRKAPVHRNTTSNTLVTTQELEGIFKSMKTMKSKQHLVESELKSLKQENGALWSELNNLRVKHAKQTQIINKLIHFLVHYMHSSSEEKRGSGRLEKENKNQTLSKRPNYFELEYKGNKPEAKKRKVGSSKKKDGGPTIFELEHNDCPIEYWKKYDEKMSDAQPEDLQYGQHIVTEPDEDSMDTVFINPNINEVIDQVNPNSPSNVQQNFPEMNVTVKAETPSTSQINAPPTIPEITDNTSITLDKALSSKEHFNMFLDNNQSELNNFQETISNLSSTDIANLLELFDNTVPLPIESGVSDNVQPTTDKLISNPEDDTPKITINPDDMLNLTNEIDSIQGENDLNQTLITDVKPDLNMTSIDYLQNENSVENDILNQDTVDLDNIINLLE